MNSREDFYIKIKIIICKFCPPLVMVKFKSSFIPLSLLAGGPVTLYLIQESLKRFPIHSQNDVSNFNFSILFSWLPWKQPFDSDNSSSKIFIAFFFHLKNTKAKASRILCQFDFKSILCSKDG